MTGQIVVVGGGIAGLEAALRIEKKLDAEVKLVEPRENLVFYPTLHRVIEGENPEKTVIDYGEKFSDRDITHVKAEMRGLDTDNSIVETTEGDSRYDKLVLAFGATTNYFGVQEDNCLSLRSLEEAEKIREKIEHGIQNAIVVGGGATGVEASVSLSQAGDFDVKLLQADERILPRNSENLSDKTAEVLEEKGVYIKTEAEVAEVNQTSVELSSGEKIQADLVLWAAGIRKKDLADELDLPTDRKGVKVDKEMEVEGYEDIYAAGDLASYDGKEARAYFALKEGKTVAENIVSQFRGGKIVERKFYWDPQIIYLGKRRSGMEIAGKTWVGFTPHIIQKYFVDYRYMLLRKHII